MSLYKYIVESGAMQRVYECPFMADPRTVATVALHEHSMAGNGGDLGQLLSVSGGQCKGKNELFFSTVSLLQDIGRMELP